MLCKLKLCKLNLNNLVYKTLRQKRFSKARSLVFYTSIVIYMLFFIVIGYLSLKTLFYLLIDYKHKNPELLMATVPTLAILILLFYLLRKFFLKINAIILSASIFLLILIFAYHSGINLPIIISLFFILVILSGFMLSSYFAFISAILSGLAFAIIKIIQQPQILTPSLNSSKSIADCLDIIFIPALFILSAILHWLYTKKIKKLLANSQEQEKKLNQELKVSQEKEIFQLRQMAEFGLISGGIFHELANPLTAINLGLEEMKKMCHNHQVWEKFKCNIEKTNKAAKKIGCFLSSARKQISRQDLIETFSLNKEIEEILEILEFKARNNRVTIFFNATQEYFLQNSPLKFHQLAINLIANAIDAFSEKKEFKNNQITVSLTKTDKHLMLSVKDNGCGLKDEYKNIIFNAFFSTKDFASGMGLGLSLVKSIIETDFQGKITVSNNNETEFVVYLPKKINLDSASLTKSCPPR